MARESAPIRDGDTDRQLTTLVERLLDSYRTDERTHHLDATFLPNRERTLELLGLLRQILFPGFFDNQRITSANVRFHVGELLSRAHELLYDQVRQALRYDVNRTKGAGEGDACEQCDAQAARIAGEFLDALPDLRRRLALDVQAAYEGDPAAQSTDEAIFCYPGLHAITVYRIAHELWRLGVPLLPRIMSECAHSDTGIDIHPGAIIGDSFFIDHGTGVVIGETTEIGNNVKLYQGVTLGAVSTKGGQSWRGRKRHPTLEDDVTIYGGAIILGGSTVIGKGATIGGSVFITSSIPPGHTVTMKKPELKVSASRDTKRKKEAPADEQPADT
ncbi:MAG: serine O-acetyltransferase EpsC, partial [Phycisphaeraceae bacterium]